MRTNSSTSDSDDKADLNSLLTLRPISRRGFLQVTGFAAGGLLAGCVSGGTGGTTPPASAGATASQRASDAAKGKPVLNVGQWGGDWEVIFRKEIAEPFEQEFDALVNVDTAWPFFPKMAAAPPDTPPLDVLNDNINQSIKMADAGMLFTPDELKLHVPILADYYDFAFNSTGVIHGWNPYGVAYRSDLVKPAPTSYADLFDPKWEGKRGTYSMPNTLGAALVMIASKIWGRDEYDFEAGLKALADAKPWKLVDFTSTMADLIERGEVVIANMHDADMLRMKVQGQPTDWVKANDAPTALIDQTMNVVKTTKNPDLAFKFLDYYLQPERHIKLIGEFFARPANRKEQVPATMAEAGIQNTEDDVKDLWVFDWKWWNEHEDDIVERYNELVVA